MNGGIATYEGTILGNSFVELDTNLNTALQDLWPGDGVVTVLKFRIHPAPYATKKKYSADFIVRHEKEPKNG